MKNLECKQNHLHGCHTKRKIPSSFHMQEPQQIFANLEIKQNDVLLDLGCGAGDYTFYAGKLVGNFGKIYALDYFSEAIVAIQSKIDSEKIKNIKAVQADITQKFPIEDSTIDICFISTVLHTIELEKNGVNLFSEIKRVLKKDGKLAIIECHKTQTLFGPPMHCRISFEYLKSYVKQFGFQKINFVDLGFNYLMQFKYA